MIRIRLAALAAGAFGALAVLTPAVAQSPQADAIFINGKVFTADGEGSVRQAFAVSGDSFSAVGTNAEIRRQAGPKTRIVDLKGRFVIPGLTDNHFHNEGGGPGFDLSQVRSMDQLLANVRKAASAAAPGTVAFSNADWHEAQLKEQRLPTVAELDAAGGGKPVVLVRGGHEMILNSLALAKWNITKATPSPAGGAIGKNVSGELNGELVDTAQKLVQLPASKPLTVDDILTTQRTLLPYGVTAVRVTGAYKGDVLVTSDLLGAYRLMQQARANGTLALRYTIYLPGFALQDAAGVRKLISDWGVKLDEGDDWIRVGGVKLMADGGFEGGHMSMPYEEPYGRGGHYRGVVVTQPGALREVVGELNRLGWRATTHAVGDAAIDQVLESYEAAHAQRPIAGRRWTIEHAFISRPEQLVRLKALDVGLSVQDHLYLAGPTMKNYWGGERAASVTPLKSYLDAGLLVSGGTDAPVIPFNPFWAIYHFISRDTISDGVYGPNERVVSRPEVLKIFTINYAMMIGEEARKGSIEKGKLADFAVLTDDLLTVAPDRIRDAKSLATYVGGKEAYRDPAF